MMVNKESRIGKRLDVFLFESLKRRGYDKFSRNFLQENWEKLVFVNDSLPKYSYKLKAEDKIRINWEKIKELEESIDRSKEILAEEGNLNVLFEEEDFLIVDKPKGMVVHPGIGNPSNTLVNKVRGYLEEKGEYDKGLKRVGLVHRLDKGVSGVIVFAKTSQMQEHLQKQFEEHKVKKIYLAKVEYKRIPPEIEKLFPEGNMDIQREIEQLENTDFDFGDDWYRVEGYIGRSNRNRIKMLFRRYKGGGSRQAISYIKPISKEKVLISIKTGRMHQIRATLNYLGINIKGDTLYEKSMGKSIPEEIALRSIFLSFNDLDGGYFSISKF
jgi:23S rRNA pseudouridine1911/1915/1917 synthase